MEPLPGVEPGDVSIPRTRGRRSEGRELAGLESNQRPRTVQSRGAPADRATGHQSPSPGSNWAGCPYRGPPDAGPKGIVSPAGFGPALPTSSRWCLLPLGYEDMASLRADLNRLPVLYERTALPGELQRHEAGEPGLEPGTLPPSPEANPSIGGFASRTNPPQAEKANAIVFM